MATDSDSLPLRSSSSDARCGAHARQSYVQGIYRANILGGGEGWSGQWHRPLPKVSKKHFWVWSLLVLRRWRWRQINHALEYGWAPVSRRGEWTLASLTAELAEPRGIFLAALEYLF